MSTESEVKTLLDALGLAIATARNNAAMIEDYPGGGSQNAIRCRQALDWADRSHKELERELSGREACPSCGGLVHDVVDGDRRYRECSAGCGYQREGSGDNGQEDS